MTDVIEEVLDQVIQTLEWICQKAVEIINMIFDRVKSILSDFSISLDKNITKKIKIDSRRQFGSQNGISNRSVIRYSIGIVHRARYYRRT